MSQCDQHECENKLKILEYPKIFKTRETDKTTKTQVISKSDAVLIGNKGQSIICAYVDFLAISVQEK